MELTKKEFENIKLKKGDLLVEIKILDKYSDNLKTMDHAKSSNLGKVLKNSGSDSFDNHPYIIKDDFVTYPKFEDVMDRVFEYDSCHYIIVNDQDVTLILKE